MPMDDLFDDDSEEDSSSSQRRYAQPDKEDFEEFLGSTGYSWEIVDDADSMEYVYESHDIFPDWTGLVLRIYSTIDERSGKARSKGSDAIRQVIIDRNIDMRVGGRKKTLRIKTWRKNLREKIESVAGEAENYVEKCDDCNDVMVLRTGQYGEFLGCRNYPSCTNTKELEE